MPEWCLTMKCIECDSHAIVGGKLDCNYLNRLGLSQPTVKTFLPDVTDPEKLDAQIKSAEEEIKKMEEETERLKKLKETVGGEKVAKEESGN